MYRKWAGCWSNFWKKEDKVCCKILVKDTGIGMIIVKRLLEQLGGILAQKDGKS